ncbi:MAG: V-type ATP synthase subunit E family protein [Oscillospiraceae bacterium]
MNGIEKITAKIDQDAQVEIDGILTQAREEAARIDGETQKKADALEASLRKKGDEAAALREERLLSVAQLEGKKMVLGTKQEMVSQAFERALAGLCALPEAQYVALLSSLAVAAAVTGREEVIFSQKDRTRYGKAVVTAANEVLAKKVSPKLPRELTDSSAGALLGRVVAGASALLNGTGMLTIAEETRPIRGGLVLRDDRVETNCSFETLIYMQRDTLANQVAQVLFP